MLFDRFELIKIINLRHRTDRREEMKREMERAGVPPSRYSFLPAIAPKESGLFMSRGANGVFHSHLAALEMAAAKGCSILILEDDCDFLPDASSFQLPERWDIFYGGYEASDPEDLEGSDIIGAHFMGFSAAAAAKLVPYLKSFFTDAFRPDPAAAAQPGYDPQVRPPIDGAYVWFRRAHPELTTVFAKPVLGVQRPSRSDITPGGFIDRVPGLRIAADVARKLKRQAFRRNAAPRKLPPGS